MSGPAEVGAQGPTPRRRGAARDWWASVPNLLTWSRLVALPFLWMLAASGAVRELGIGVAAASATDALDGAIARRFHSETSRGSRLDSIADHLLTASTSVWLVWLRPEFVRAQLPLLAAWLLLAGAALLASWLRFRRLADLHLYSAKVAAIVGYLFAVWLLVVGDYSERVFYLVLLVCAVAPAETLAVVLTRDVVDERVGSVFRRPRGRDA